MKLQKSFLLVGVFSISVLNSGCNNKQDATVYSVAKETPSAQHAGTPTAMPPGHPTVGAMTGEAAMSGNPAPEINVGTPPPQWKMKGPTPMRVASFEVKGDKETVADISLILLNGAAGGVLDNVNRWQSQLGQPDLTAENLAQKEQHLQSPLGELTVVDLQGLPQGADAATDGRIVAAIASNNGVTFFFKMRGNAELVGAQKEDFIKWVCSAHTGAAKAETATQPATCPVAPPAHADASPTPKS